MRLKFTLLFCLILSSCSYIGITKHQKADHLARKNNFEKKILKGGDFWITTYQKITSRSLGYVFYIEGDGYAFKNSFTISKDPTPLNPMLFNLATLDDRPNIVYIAIPCQNTRMALNEKCIINPDYWTEKRFTAESINAILDIIKNITDGNKKYDLVGFSGGGAIATIIASIDVDNVKSITTIGGNLNIDEFNRYHNVIPKFAHQKKPMEDSINPINIIDKISNIAQLHISGGKDRIIPPFIGYEFVLKGNPKCMKHEIVPEASHDKGWEKSWKKFLKFYPLTCDL